MHRGSRPRPMVRSHHSLSQFTTTRPYTTPTLLEVSVYTFRVRSEALPRRPKAFTQFLSAAISGEDRQKARWHCSWMLPLARKQKKHAPIDRLRSSFFDSSRPNHQQRSLPANAGDAFV